MYEGYVMYDEYVRLSTNVYVMLWVGSYEWLWMATNSYERVCYVMLGMDTNGLSMLWKGMLCTWCKVMFYIYYGIDSCTCWAKAHCLTSML